MANPEHLAILKQGVKAWNTWREANPDVLPDLRQADLCNAALDEAYLRWVRLSRARLVGASIRGSDLRSVRLLGAKLRGANLDAANLTGVDLRHADLCEANLSGANMSWVIGTRASFRRSTLSGADLTSARISSADLRQSKLIAVNLSGADLSRANLTGADLHKAQASSTRFASVDLSVVERLESVVHTGPSTVGIDTIYKSKGKIPEEFLRGCGVPDEFIAYIRSMSRAAHRVLLLLHQLFDQRPGVCRQALRRSAKQRRALLVCAA